MTAHDPLLSAPFLAALGATIVSRAVLGAVEIRWPRGSRPPDWVAACYAVAAVAFPASACVVGWFLIDAWRGAILGRREGW